MKTTATTHRSLIPTINVAPIGGYRMHQCVSPFELKARIAARDADVIITREVYFDGKQQENRSVVLRLRDGEWTNREDIYFEMESVADIDAGQATRRTGYIETHFVSDGEPVFTTLYPPNFYSVFDVAGGKAYYSDGALKFANPYVIDQIHKFGEWSETYPACEIDPSRDVSMSVILINPYPLPTVVRLQLIGGGKSFSHQLPPTGASIIDLRQHLEPGVESWRGALLAWSRNRVNLFVASHAISDPTCISTIEHSEVYRASETCQSVYDKVRGKVRRFVVPQASSRLRELTRKIPRVGV